MAHDSPSSIHLIMASEKSQYFTEQSSDGVSELIDFPDLGYDRWKINLVPPLLLGTKPIGDCINELKGTSEYGLQFHFLHHLVP